MFLMMALVACGGADKDQLATDDVVGHYELGWEIDSCRNDIEGTGQDVGDVLPQYEFLAQTGETVKLHDWCNHVVFIELGYFG